MLLKKIKGKQAAFFAISLLAVLIFFCGCNTFKFYAYERIEEYSGIDLPDDKMTEVYTFVDETFTGLAGQYSVFNYSGRLDVEDDETDRPVDWNENLDAGVRENICYFLDNWEVPSEYYPDFSADYRYACGAEGTYVFDFYNQHCLKIFMFGH